MLTGAQSHRHRHLPEVTVAVPPSNADTVVLRHRYTQLSNKYFLRLLLWIAEVLSTPKTCSQEESMCLCEKTFLRDGAGHAFLITV